MNSKKVSVTKKEKSVTKSKTAPGKAIKEAPVKQVNPVSQRIQTEEGWRRSQIKLRTHNKKVKG